jgi:hypothetical protein
MGAQATGMASEIIATGKNTSRVMAEALGASKATVDTRLNP